MEVNIPPRVNLHKRGMEIAINCPVCSEKVETTDHILFECSRAKGIWDMTFKHELLYMDFNDQLY